MTDRSTLVIGTRGSPLALAQAHETQTRLMRALGIEADALPIQVIKVMGDAIQDRPLSEAGGMGLFTKEIDIAQLEGAVDIAVHSAKDLPNELPEGLCIAGYLPREDVRDAFISPLGPRIQDLPQGTRVGSASLRRQAMIRRLRPDLDVALMRGNVNTRLAKLERGEYGATLLALAGLKRLGLEHHVTTVLDTDEFLPAVGQGAIAITTRVGDERAREAASGIIDEATGIALAAERAFLRVLDGSCRTPIAGYARVTGGKVSFRGMVLRPDGSQSVETAATGTSGDAGRLGTEAGHEVRDRIPPGFFTA